MPLSEGAFTFITYFFIVWFAITNIVLLIYAGKDLIKTYFME